MRDTIVHIDLEADIELFLREVELIGSEDLLSETAQRFFVARAISHVAAKNTVQDTIGRVMEKIEDSIRRYYYQEQNTSHIEKRLIDAWIQMTQGFVTAKNLYV